MVPSVFVAVDELPRTPGGKIDRRALPAPDAPSATASGAVPPRTPVETTVCAVWCEVLGLESVGVFDNFFEIGGDSILSIQIVARSAERGVRFSVRDIFERQTVAAVAAVAELAVGGPLTEAAPASGPYPLSPIQRWFFELDLPNPSHFNQSQILRVPADVDPVRLRDALVRVTELHDVLRSRFARTPDGWTAAIGDDADVDLVVVDCGHVPADDVALTLATKGADVQSSLDLEDGPVLRAALFRFAEPTPPRLLIAIHHLIVDAVSWQILLQDVERAYRGKLQSPRTSSFAAWSSRLADWATSDEAAAELPHWSAVARAEPVVPTDSNGPNAIASAAGVEVVLTADETEALLRRVPAAYGSRVDDALLAALALAWSAWSGRRRLLVELESHGREPLFDDLDLTRTVGWFTTTYPVVVGADSADPGAVLRATKESLRSVPRHGVGYGVLRYLADPETRAQLAALPTPQVTFNYLGQLRSDGGEDGAALLLPVDEPRGPEADGRGLRSHVLDFNGGVFDGCLRLGITYSANQYRTETVQRLADCYRRALLDLIDHSSGADRRAFTPSDFPLAGLDQRALDELMTQLQDD